MTVLILFVIAIWVRVWNLNWSPPSMNFDEAALGYNSYSLLKTARDEYGNYLPLSLRSFNDYKPAMYSYLSMLPISLMGLNDGATRAVSSAAGVITVVLLFLVLKEYVRGRASMLLAFSIVVVQPWLIHYSRSAFESNVAATFFLAGVWLLIKEKPVLSAIPFTLGAYTYHSPRLAVPLLLLIFAVDHLWPELKKLRMTNFQKYLTRDHLRLAFPLIIFVVLTLPIFISMRDSLILKRYQQTNIFKVFYPFAPKELITPKDPWLSFPANPIYYLGGMLLGHGASYFSPINLGERVYHIVRFSPMNIASFGILGWFESLMLIPGFIFLLGQLTKRKYRLLLYWIMAGSAPAIVTWEWFHPLRSLNVFPALMIVSILGLFYLGKGVLSVFQGMFPRVKPAIFYGFMALAYTGVFIPTLIFVFENELDYTVYANHGEYQPGGYKEGIPILTTLQNKYDKVIIDTPHAQAFIFFLFYQRFLPEEIQKYAPIRPSPLTEGDLTFNFANYEFRKIDWPKDKSLHRVIFWASPDLNLDDVRREPGTRIIEIRNAIGTNAAFIITKD